MTIGDNRNGLSSMMTLSQPSRSGAHDRNGNGEDPFKLKGLKKAILLGRFAIVCSTQDRCPLLHYCIMFHSLLFAINWLNNIIHSPISILWTPASLSRAF
eukprot:scaffold11693_cov116-Skeletonema_dohrnii-CCMP3373.AAC.5